MIRWVFLTLHALSYLCPQSKARSVGLQMPHFSGRQITHNTIQLEPRLSRHKREFDSSESSEEYGGGNHFPYRYGYQQFHPYAPAAVPHHDSKQLILSLLNLLMKGKGRPSRRPTKPGAPSPASGGGGKDDPQINEPPPPDPPADPGSGPNPFGGINLSDLFGEEDPSSANFPITTRIKVPPAPPAPSPSSRGRPKKRIPRP
ncbi:hypothetical protein BV898_15574 [Hypsibius exemplaris]|uniref:Uncharacterized protein n=1 Tax=Hypsibius exemplaris TaxID=2072580 RepID=A0A9X6NDA7_HYPEX|nr:hypothetical protein BV898_15574 [Hypsibius exemplaris]